MLLRICWMCIVSRQLVANSFIMLQYIRMCDVQLIVKFSQLAEKTQQINAALKLAEGELSTDVI